MRGRNLITGLPEAIEVSSIEIREALAPPSVQVIIDTIKDALDESPPEILADLMDSGICLAGGTSQLQGWLNALPTKSACEFGLLKTPLTCVARGCGMIFDDVEQYEGLLVGIERDPYSSDQS